MAINAAGLNVQGQSNPNWKGGKITKNCAFCGVEYKTRPGSKSSFCSLQCVGKFNKGKPAARKVSRQVEKACEVCEKQFYKPQSHAPRHRCCSRACSNILRSKILSDERNPNWKGGLSRLPYPWNFRKISKRIIELDGFKCQGPECKGTDSRLTTHHINYDKQDNLTENLICLCSSCNSIANFNREKWKEIYTAQAKKRGGGWKEEAF